MLTKNVLRFALVVLVLFAAGSAWAQGEFMRGDETGVGLASSVIFSSDTGYGFSAGWAFDPNLDLNFSYAAEAGGDNGVTSALLSVYAKAESGDNLLGIVFSGGFFRGDRASESAFLLGMGMFGNLPLSDRFLLQPSWFAGTIILDENSGNQTSANMSAALLYGHQKKFRPFLKLGYVSQSGGDLNGAAVQIGFVKTH